jgi:phosphopantothenoylcysteine synthetase/decarboxylase
MIDQNNTKYAARMTVRAPATLNLKSRVTVGD